MPTDISLDHLKMEVAIVASELALLKERGTASSSIRARAHLLNIKKECDSLRKLALNYQKAYQAEKKGLKSVENISEVVEPPVTEVVVPHVAEVVMPEGEEEDVPVIKVKSRKARKVPKGRKVRVK